MTRSAPRAYRVSLRLYVVFSVLVAASAVASGLFLLYLARPFASELSAPQARQLAVLLFTGAAVAGALAAVGGLILGLNLAGRIRGIVEKAEAFSPQRGPPPPPPPPWRAASVASWRRPKRSPRRWATSWGAGPGRRPPSATS